MIAWLCVLLWAALWLAVRLVAGTPLWFVIPAAFLSGWATLAAAKG